MGDYSTLHVTGIVKKEYREKLAWFFRPGSCEVEDFINVFSLDPPETQATVKAFLGMDRASFTLRGSLSYAPDPSWYELESRKVGSNGFLRILTSSKNRDTHVFFVKNIVPLIYEEGFEGYVSPYL